MRWLQAICTPAFVALVALQPVHADEIDRARRVAEVIEEYANGICGPLFQGGSQTQLAVNGDVSALSSALVKRLIELGVSGAAKYEHEKYVGPPREQLVAENANARECRLAVRNDLVHLFRIGDGASSIQNNGSIVTGDKSPVVIGTDGSVNIIYGQ